MFPDSPKPMLDARATHRDHAIIEQVITDLTNSALAPLLAGQFDANGAWLVCAAIAHHLTRATGVLASRFHARAQTHTIRTQLINVSARITRSAKRLILHLPQNWPCESALDDLLRHTLHDPALAAA